MDTILLNSSTAQQLNSSTAQQLNLSSSSSKSKSKLLTLPKFPQRNFFCALLSSLFLFATLACGGSGGGSDSGDSSSSLPMTPKVTGMREFLLSVDGAGKTGSIAFIASASALAPAWTEVENNPAKLTRTFDDNTREIYFSVTNDYTDPGTIEANRVVDVSGGDVAGLTAKGLTGFMIPGGNYYVHAYSGGEHIGTSAKITTAGYPAALPAYPNTSVAYSGALWGMDMWNKTITDGGTILATIELNPQEVTYFPLRMLKITSLSGSCSLGAVSKVSLVKKSAFAESLTTLVYPPTTGASYHTDNPAEDRSLLFNGRYSGKEYYDVMGKYILTNNQHPASQRYLRIATNCLPVPGVTFTFTSFNLSEITE